MRTLLFCPMLVLIAGCAAESPGNPRSSGAQATPTDRPIIVGPVNGGGNAFGASSDAPAQPESAVRR